MKKKNRDGTSNRIQQKRASARSPRGINLARTNHLNTRQKKSAVLILKRWDGAWVSIARALGVALKSLTLAFIWLFQARPAKKLAYESERGNIVGPISIILLACFFSLAAFYPFDTVSQLLQYMPAGLVDDPQGLFSERAFEHPILVTAGLLCYALLHALLAYAAGRIWARRPAEVVAWSAYALSFFIIVLSTEAIIRFFGFFKSENIVGPINLTVAIAAIGVAPLVLGALRLMEVRVGPIPSRLKTISAILLWLPLSYGIILYFGYSFQLLNDSVEKIKSIVFYREQREGEHAFEIFGLNCKGPRQLGSEDFYCRLNLLNITKKAYSVTSVDGVTVVSDGRNTGKAVEDFFDAAKVEFSEEPPTIIKPGDGLRLLIRFSLVAESEFCKSLNRSQENNSLLNFKVSMTVDSAPKSRFESGFMNLSEAETFGFLSRASYAIYGLENSCALEKPSPPEIN